MLDRQRRGATRLAWSLWAITMLLFLAASAFRVIDWSVARPRNSATDVFLVAGVGLYLTYPLVGALIASRHPRNPVGWLFCAIGLVLGVANLAGDYALRGLIVAPGSLPGALWMAWLQAWLPFVWFPALLVALFLLFPDGKPPTPRWSVVIWMGIVASLSLMLTAMLAPTPLKAMNGISVVLSKTNPTAIDNRPLLQVLDAIGISIVISIVGAAAALVVRFRRSSGDEREQMKWLVYVAALIASFVLVSALSMVAAGSPHETPNQPTPLAFIIAEVAFFSWLILFAIALPTAMGIAILKYRLYDIDVIINKSLVYGALAVFITSVYVAIVVGIGSAIGTGGKPNLALAILATAIVAVAFQPVRERIQGLANQLVFGIRATPYQVIAEFSEHMAGVLSPDEVLPRMAETAARGVGASEARIQMSLPDGTQRNATWSEASSGRLTRFAFPVTDHGEQLGEIDVAKASGEPLRPAERRLLTDLATQAGLVLRNVRLAHELQHRLDEISGQAKAIRASRQRIVTAQDTERLRLEESIHERVESPLIGIKAELHRTEQIVIADARSAAVLLDGLIARANDTLEGLRDLARGIYPPLLRERGLAAALQAQVEKMQVRSEITTNGVGRYPSEIEAAIYFTCLEVLRSSTGPSAIRISATDDSLQICISASRIDLDGRIQDIEDRIQALGGSLAVTPTELRGQVPISVLEPVA